MRSTLRRVASPRVVGRRQNQQWRGSSGDGRRPRPNPVGAARLRGHPN